MTLTPEEIEIRKLLDTYGDSLFRLSCSFMRNEADAEDAVQEVMIQYLRYRPVFDDSQKEKGWFMKTCSNICRNKLRSSSAHPQEELNDLIKVEEKEDYSFVWEAVSQLPTKYRVVIHLFYEEGYSTREIAKITGRLEPSVRSDLFRARKQLKEILKEAYDFE